MRAARIEKVPLPIDLPQPGQHPALDALAVALGIQIIPEPANLPPPGRRSPRSIKACKTACFSPCRSPPRPSGFRQLCQLLVFLRRHAGEEARRVVLRLLRLVHLAPEVGVVGGVAADLP